MFKGFYFVKMNEWRTMTRFDRGKKENAATPALSLLHLLTTWCDWRMEWLLPPFVHETLAYSVLSLSMKIIFTGREKEVKKIEIMNLNRFLRLTLDFHLIKLILNIANYFLIINYWFWSLSFCFYIIFLFFNIEILNFS